MFSKKEKKPIRFSNSSLIALETARKVINFLFFNRKELVIVHADVSYPQIFNDRTKRATVVIAFSYLGKKGVLTMNFLMQKTNDDVWNFIPNTEVVYEYKEDEASVIQVDENNCLTLDNQFEKEGAEEFRKSYGVL